MGPVEPRHVCNACNDEFLSEQEYNAHVCPKTGFTPADPEHHGPEFLEIQKAALQRGAARLTSENSTIEDVQRQAAAISQVEATIELREQTPETPADEQPIISQAL